VSKKEVTGSDAGKGTLMAKKGVGEKAEGVSDNQRKKYPKIGLRSQRGLEGEEDR